MNRLMIVSLLGIATALGGCVSPPPKPNDPYYAPVLPRTRCPPRRTTARSTRPASSRILRRPQGLPRGRHHYHHLNEKTQASKKANSDIQKDSKTKMGLTSLFGSGMTTNNPIGGGDLSLSAEYGGSRDAKGDSQAGQSNSLTGSITVTVAEVLPNGILSVRGEKWMTLNTGNELVRIAGLVRADDIATDNTVSSTRVADARITYSGTGAFADASQPGWLDRFFLSPLWPF